MNEDDRGRAKSLARIAELLGQSVASFSTDSGDLALLAELIDLWPKLTDRDRLAVIAFATSRAARSGTSKP